MSWMNLAGGALQAASIYKGARTDVKRLAENARIQNAQADRDEEAQRRQARQVLGAQAAMYAQAGGVDEGMLRQSAIAAELDALNIRYRGRAQARGLFAQAKDTASGAPLGAAAALLSGGTAYYAGRKAAA